MDSNPIASSSSGGVIWFLRPVPWPDHFLLDVLDGSGHKTNVGIIGDHEMSFVILGDYETTYTVSSIIGVGEEISRLDS